MNEFQEQAKNWLRNVVKQNPDKIKAGVAKAGDLIDQQTGGKYAAKVDAVQEKVGSFVDKQSGDAAAPSQSTPEPADTTASADETTGASDAPTATADDATPPAAD